MLLKVVCLKNLLNGNSQKILDRICKSYIQSNFENDPQVQLAALNPLSMNSAKWSNRLKKRQKDSKKRAIEYWNDYEKL